MSDAAPTHVVRHYYVDESGDGLLFGARGNLLVGEPNHPGNFILGLLEVADIQALERDMNDLRGRLMADPYFFNVPSMKPGNSKTALAFHAKNDLPEIRMEVFHLLVRHEFRFTAVVKSLHAVLAYVRQRNQANPAYRYHPDELYDHAARLLFRGRLHKDREYAVVFARRGQSNRTRALAENIERVRDAFCMKLGIPADSRIVVRSAFSHEHAGLQAADYFLWAIQRLYERGEERYLNFIWPKIALVHDVDDTREKGYGRYYNEKRPLTAMAVKGRLRI